MQDPSLDATKQIAEEKFRESYQLIASQANELVKQEYDGDRATLFLVMVSQKFGQEIIQTAQELTVNGTIKGVVVAQSVERGVIIIPFPIEMLQGQDADAFIRGMKEAYEQSDQKEHIVVGVVTAALDSAFGVYSREELAKQKERTDFVSWESDATKLFRADD